MTTANQTTAIFSQGTRRSRHTKDLSVKCSSSLDEWDKEAEDGDLCAAKRLQPLSRRASALSPAASSPLTKRLRTECTPHLTSIVSPPFQIPIDDLCGGIIQRIYSMLNDPRDIWNFSRCSKRLGELVEYKSIVRAAAFNAIIREKEKPIRILKTIERAMSAESAYVPSPQRLLRVVNGTRCEMGSNCWNYNFEENTTPRVGKCHSSCIFICNECENNLHSCVRPYSQVDSLRNLLNRIKLEIGFEDVPYISSRPLSIPITENNTESESIGFYITMRDLKQMTISCNASTQENMSDKWDPEEAQIAKAPEFITRLNVRMGTDPKNSFRPKLINYIQEALKDCKTFKFEIEEKKYFARVKLFRMKLNKYRIIHDKLSDLLGEADWKDFALDCKWDSCDNFYTFDKPVAAYSCDFVQCYMEKYIIAPSTVRMKHLAKIADMIKLSFRIVSSSGFFDYDYLSCEDVYENALRQYALEHFTPATVYKLVKTHHIKYILDGDLITALSLVSQVDLKHNYGIALRILDFSSDNPYFSANDFRKYAIGLFKRSSSNDENRCVPRMKALITAFANLFDAHKASILAYLNDERTQAFLSDISESDHHHLTRAEIVRRCLLNVHTRQEEFLWHLSATNASRLAFHQRVFQDPASFYLVYYEDYPDE